MAGKKARIKVQEATPWGEVPENYVADPRKDRWFIPGYSDVRRDNERKARRGEAQTPLPYRFQFTSVEGTVLGEQGKKAAEFMDIGYVPVKWDEAEKYGIRTDGTAMRKGPDGTIRVAGQMLMATPASNAAGQYASVQKRNERRLNAAKSKVNAAVEQFQMETGVRPGVLHDDQD